MSTRQYIGARYVPKFADPVEWQSNTAYEHLTVVTRNGNSYTSRKTVPANIGAPENNPDYWASTGIYNQQVEAYRQEVANLSERVDDEFQDVNEDISEINSLINLDFNALKGKKILIVGSSNERDMTLSDGSYTWTKWLKNMLSGIATVTIDGVSSRNLRGSYNAMVSNYDNHDIVILKHSSNDAIQHIGIGNRYDGDNNSLWSVYRDMRTFSTAHPQTLFYYGSLFNPTAPWMYNYILPNSVYFLADIYAAHWAGWRYIDMTLANGTNNIASDVYYLDNHAHFKDPYTKNIAYYVIKSIVNYCGNPTPSMFVPNHISNITVDGTTYNCFTNLFTLAENVTYVSLGKLLVYPHEMVLRGRFNVPAPLAARTPIMTLRDELRNIIIKEPSWFNYGRIYAQGSYISQDLLLSTATGNIYSPEEFTSSGGIIEMHLPYEWATDVWH